MFDLVIHPIFKNASAILEDFLYTNFVILLFNAIFPN